MNRKLFFERSYWTLLFVFIFSSGFYLRMETNDANWKKEFKVIDSDGIFYYSYLPSTFIKKQNQATGFPSMQFHSNKSTPTNKYFIGTSVLMAPFFLITHLYTNLHYWISPETAYPADGISFPYHVGILFGSAFYLIFGLILLKKMAVGFGVNKVFAIALLSIFGLGSQLFILSSYEGSLAHVYAFFAISALLYYWNKITKNPTSRSYLMVVFLIVLLGLIRPTDVLIVSIFPIFFLLNGGSKKVLIWCKKQRINHFLGILIGASMLIIQLIYWKLQSGSFFIWSYKNEGFDFSNPQIFNVLFSYKKGLFIYTPILLISFVIIFFSKIQWKIKLWFLFFFLLNIYVISSWWCWWYGGSYGMRAFMDFMPVIILLVMLTFAQCRNNYIKISCIILMLACVPYNMIQTYQYTSKIMHYDTMNKDKFWQIFMKTDDIFKFVTFDQPEYYAHYKTITSKVETITDETIHLVNQQNQYHTLVQTRSDSVLFDSGGTYLKVCFEGKIDKMDQSGVLCWWRANEDGSQSYRDERIISFIRKSGKWIKAEIIVDLCKKGADEVDFHLAFNNGTTNNFQFKNVRIERVNYRTAK